MMINLRIGHPVVTINLKVKHPLVTRKKTK